MENVEVHAVRTKEESKTCEKVDKNNVDGGNQADSIGKTKQTTSNAKTIENAVSRFLRLYESSNYQRINRYKRQYCIKNKGVAQKKSTSSSAKQE